MEINKLGNLSFSMRRRKEKRKTSSRIYKENIGCRTFVILILAVTNLNTLSCFLLNGLMILMTDQLQNIFLFSL